MILTHLKKNVIRLNKSVETAMSASFEGNADAEGKYPTITLNVTSYQSQIALIPYATGTAGADEVVFKNFNVTGSITGRSHLAGLIWTLSQSETKNAKTKTTSDYIFENVNMDLNINQNETAGSTNAAAGNVGGFIAQANYATVLKDYPKINMNSISYTGNITLIANSGTTYSGGLIGYFTDSNANDGNNIDINISNYTYSGNFTDERVTSALLSHGGVIGWINKSGNNYQNQTINGYSNGIYYGRTKINLENIVVDNVNINMPRFSALKDTPAVLGGNLSQIDAVIKNVSISNVSINTTSSYNGVVFAAVSGNMDVDGLTMRNVSVSKTSTSSGFHYTSMFMRQFTSGVCNLTNFDIDESCKVQGQINPQAVFEICALTANLTNNRYTYGGIINLNGSDKKGQKYGAYNAYEIKGQYLDLAGNEISSSGNPEIYYNMFENASEGFIKGTGTADNPIIIDTPEKMVIMSAFSNEALTSKDLFMKYFGDIEGVLDGSEANNAVKKAKMISVVMNAYVVFAKDLDLSTEEYGYSYYSMPVRGGKYFGFNAYKYLEDKGILSPTQEQIKNVCISAIAAMENGKELTEYNNYKSLIHMDADKINSLNESKSGKYLYLDKTNKGISIAEKNLYSGVFTNIVAAEVGIYNILLKGNYYNSFYSSNPRGGALITDSTYFVNGEIDSITEGSNVIVKYIDIGDLKVESTTDTSSGSNTGIGLLVSTITASTVDFDYITISNFAHANIA